MKLSKKSIVQFSFKLFVVILVNLLFLIVIYRDVSALSRIGSQGDEVKAIQKELTNQGYFSGKVDGIFGEQTYKALVKYQKAKGLTADGIAGNQTLKALGIKSESYSGGGYGDMSENDFQLFARIISAESRGEPFEGQVAVGAVILNRIKHPSFPNTMSGVIYQKGAFSCVDDGGINAAVAESSYKAARQAINGSDPSGGAIYYYNPVKSTNTWILSRPIITVIGEHRFCS